MFHSFLMLAIGLIVLGIVASAMGGSIMPLIVIILVVMAGSCFSEGMASGSKRRRKR